jgi:hypothetical protein
VVREGGAERKRAYMAKKSPELDNPRADLGTELQKLIGVTGAIQDTMGGYRIAIYHTGAFPWAHVFKALLYRDFQIWVTRKKADLFIEAKP